LSFVCRVPCTYAAFENNLENNKEVWRVSQTDKTLEMLSLRPGKCERKIRDISSVKNNEGSDRIVPPPSSKAALLAHDVHRKE